MRFAPQRSCKPESECYSGWGLSAMVGPTFASSSAPAGRSPGDCWRCAWPAFCCCSFILANPVWKQQERRSRPRRRRAGQFAVDVAGRLRRRHALRPRQGRGGQAHARPRVRRRNGPRVAVDLYDINGAPLDAPPAAATVDQHRPDARARTKRSSRPAAAISSPASCWSATAWTTPAVPISATWGGDIGPDLRPRLPRLGRRRPRPGRHRDRRPENAPLSTTNCRVKVHGRQEGGGRGGRDRVAQAGNCRTRPRKR